MLVIMKENKQFLDYLQKQPRNVIYQIYVCSSFTFVKIYFHKSTKNVQVLILKIDLQRIEQTTCNGYGCVKNNGSNFLCLCAEPEYQISSLLSLQLLSIWAPFHCVCRSCDTPLCVNSGMPQLPKNSRVI